MKVGGPRGAESFVRALLDGRLNLAGLDPFPTLRDGRVQQVDDLLSQLRLDDDSLSGIERLRRWDLLSGPIDWPAPLLARVIRQVGGADSSAALSAIVHLALGVRLIRTWGTEAQFSDFFQTPDALCAFALTEASPGSDVSRIQSLAEPVGDEFILSGTKHWVTNAQWATHFVVVARTSPPRAASKPRLTAFLVKRQPGVEISPLSSDVLPGSGVSEVRFDNVRLTRANVLGSVGKGFRIVMAGLSEARLFVGAAVVGACIRAFNDTLDRAGQRRAFGRSVGKFPSVQSRISSMLGDIVAMESLVHGVAGSGESGAPIDPVERGVVRLFVSRGAARVLDAARELHGAAAYAGDLASARRWADARALTLLDGSDLALESYIVLEGTREIRHRLQQLADPGDLLGKVDAAASLFLSRAKHRVQRATVVEVPGMRMGQLVAYADRLGAAVDEAVRRHGVELVEKQHTHRRLAAVTSELSAWAALAARVQAEVKSAGEVGARRMIDAGNVWLDDARYRIEAHLEKVEANKDKARDAVADRAFTDKAYPFDIF